MSFSIKIDPIISTNALIETERKTASFLQFKERAIEKVIGYGYRVRNATYDMADAVMEVAYKVDDCITNLKISLRNRKSIMRKRYFTNMQKLAADQVKYRHERLAVIALEKVKLETEAETLKLAAEMYQKKI
jgi:hypothetical protein